MLMMLDGFSTSQYQTNKLQKETPQRFKTGNLQINRQKTDEYDLERGGDESWKKCKYVGRLIDTEEDIKLRNQLSMVLYIQQTKNISQVLRSH